MHQCRTGNDATDRSGRWCNRRTAMLLSEVFLGVSPFLPAPLSTLEIATLALTAPGRTSKLPATGREWRAEFRSGPAQPFGGCRFGKRRSCRTRWRRLQRISCPPGFSGPLLCTVRCWRQDCAGCCGHVSSYVQRDAQCRVRHEQGVAARLRLRSFDARWDGRRIAAAIARRFGAQSGLDFLRLRRARRGKVPAAPRDEVHPVLLTVS